MIKTQMIMGMPIIVQIEDEVTNEQIFQDVFSYLTYVDNKFSTYKSDSEISKINSGLILEENYSEDMKLIFKLAKKTKEQTNGYFDILNPKGYLDPSGIVKGWAISNASKIIEKSSYKNFCVYAGGDIQTKGHFKNNTSWKIGIQNPFDTQKIVKTVNLTGQGIATSGNYVRGNHIYCPHNPNIILDDIVSLTVVANDVFEADTLATAAYAMGKDGITFLSKIKNIHAYSIDKFGIATMTEGFKQFVDSIK